MSCFGEDNLYDSFSGKDDEEECHHEWKLVSSTNMCDTYECTKCGAIRRE